MTLALATAAKAQPFNGLFYATAATIIPVLFLALAVQGKTYRDLLKGSETELTRRRERLKLKEGSSAWRHPLAGYPRWMFRQWAAGGIMAFGTLGEIRALVALWEQRPESGWGLVLISLIFLVVATAAGPFLATARALAVESLTESKSPASTAAEPTAELAHQPGSDNNHKTDTPRDPENGPDRQGR